MSDVRIAKNDQGLWCVYIGDRLMSRHGTQAGAIRSANGLIRAEGGDPDE